MVFESLVSDLLNRFVGDYVENLDSSQLRIGIWGGNVVLENLRVKENALSQLGVPVKVKAGLIGSLTLKIPWKNLYKEAVVATLDGLYLLLTPAAAGEYDEAKEERDRQEAKRRHLLRVEQALRTAAGPDQEGKSDSLLEKLATQVIKNLQVKINRVHLRYEDDVTDPRRPLALGVTLAELSLQTADENWKLSILDQAAKIVYKLGRLERLCAYWNVNGAVLRREAEPEVLAGLKEGIGGEDRQGPLYDYVFEPILATARIRIDPDAEKVPDSPKTRVDLEVGDVDVQITKAQYVSAVEMLESAERMAKNAPYRKFRPGVPVRAHAVAWWRYAIGGILEVQVRGRTWSWSDIRRHRRDLKAYKSAYKSKILSRDKLGPDAERQLQEMEKVLDVFNITLARQQAQMEAIRSGQKPPVKKAGKGDGRGWSFAGFFGRKPKKEEEEPLEEQEEESQGSALDAVLTAEEKEKLYAAIGYSAGEGGGSTTPKEYVALALNFQLRGASLTVRESSGVPEILRVRALGLACALRQRPGARALRAEASLQGWNVTGLRQNGRVPSLVSSAEEPRPGGGGDRAEGRASLLHALLELNPDDSPANHVVRIHSQSVQIIYDAVTINSLAEFFRMAQEVDLEVLTSATLSKLEEIKEKTATGLAHIIETRKVLDLKVDLRPSYLVLPRSGFYSESSEAVVLDFGNLQFNSADENLRSPSSSFSSLEEVMERAYERYRVELTRVQVLYGQSAHEWKASRLRDSSRQHILRPLDLTLHLSKCVVDDDVRMPRFKASGELPLVHVKMSDETIRKVAALLRGIPLPRRPESAPRERQESRAPARAAEPALLGAAETDSDSDEEPRRPEMVDLCLDFEVKEVLLELTRRDDEGGESTALALGVSRLGARGQIRTFDAEVTSYLRRITLDSYRVPGGDPVRLVDCSEQRNADLLRVRYVRADADGPDFRTLFDNTEQRLQVDFSSLDFHLHGKALLSAVEFLSGVAPPPPPSGRRPDAEKREDEGHGPVASKGGGDADVFRWKLSATLGCFHAELCDDRGAIADIRVRGLEASAWAQAKRTRLSAHLRDIAVTDADPSCIHKQAVSVVGEEVLGLELSLFPGATRGHGYGDVSKVDGELALRLGCIKMVYLHKFLASLLAFADHFHPAREAVSAATAQAAEKAASGVRRLARKSLRLSLDVRLKAPLVVVPRSALSRDAILVDLGLLTVSNGFAALPSEGFPLPAVVETLDVRLAQLKLSRGNGSCASDVEILEPVNVELLVTRNMASSWFTHIPGVRVEGVLPSLHLSVGEEDLLLLAKILQENMGQGSSERRGPDGATGKVERRAAEPGSAVEPAANGDVSDDASDDAVNVSVDFQISQVVLSLKKKKTSKDEGARGQAESPFLALHLAHLGVDAKVRKYDTRAALYVKRMQLSCMEFKDSDGDHLSLVHSSSGDELLKVQYLKADRSGPNFSSVYKNTERMINVTLASLELVLHAQALLSALHFFSGVLSPAGGGGGGGAAAPREPVVTRAPDDRPAQSDVDARPAALHRVVELKAVVDLGAFRVLVCDQRGHIVDVKIQGLHGSLTTRGPETHVSARLKDLAVLDADPASLHRQAVSIEGDEVFSFSVSLTPDATEGAGYADTSASDGRFRLNVGRLRVVYLHKLATALVNFGDHFQTAKAAVSAATERAASSVRDFAGKSFRLSAWVELKAPLVVVPRSSTSYDALVADLGLLSVSNAFSLLPVDGRPLPAVVDKTDVRLTRLKVARMCLDPAGDGASGDLLEPVDLNLRLNRNLSASWYHQVAAVELDGDLAPMKVALSQEDLRMLLTIVTENLAEAEESAPGPELEPEPGPGPPQPPTDLRLTPTAGGDEEHLDQDRDGDGDGNACSVKFNFRVESLGLLLYKEQADAQSSEQSRLCLGELAFRLLDASGKIYGGGGAGHLELRAVLTDCALDDRRTGVDRVTSRMVGRREASGGDPAVDVTYRQNGGRRSVEAVLQSLYVCASVEFLTAVGDFFLGALPPPLPAKSRGRAAASAAAQRRKRPKDAPPSEMAVHAVVMDPEVVFVASLADADAPSLALSFQCDVSARRRGDGARSLKARLRSLRILARPFVTRGHGGGEERPAVAATVLRPCSVDAQMESGPGRPPAFSFAAEELVVKISPFILDTVGNITAAVRGRGGHDGDDDGGDDSSEPREMEDLWAAHNVYELDYWFLGVERATEVTENFGENRDLGLGQHLDFRVKVVRVTLESGPGHRTVPLLLAESSLGGRAENWSSLPRLKANLTLEVNYFNAVHAVWEPLIERVEGGARPWKLDLEVKTNPEADRSPAHGDEFVIPPEARTDVRVSSDDTLNVTLSRGTLDVLTRLAEAFSGSAAATFDPSAREKAPVSVFNALGVPLLLRPGADLRPAGAARRGQLLELPPLGVVELEHSHSEAGGTLSAPRRSESRGLCLTVVPSGYSEIADVPVDKPGRRLYNVRGPELRRSLSLVVQMDGADGNKLVTVRSPLQIQNHFSVPFTVLKRCPDGGDLQTVGVAQPEEEFHIPLDAYRLRLFLQPASRPYAPSSTCLSWKEEARRGSEVLSLLTCPPSDGEGGDPPLTVSVLATPDALTHVDVDPARDEWEPAYVLHLRPVATLRNLLPYALRYTMENCGDSHELAEGATSHLLNARAAGETLCLELPGYQGRDWRGQLRLERTAGHFPAVRMTCVSERELTLELSVHARVAAGRLLLSVYSPFWMVNKTRRVLRYRADGGVQVKHATDFRDVILFSFHGKNLLGKNKIQMCVSNSSWSDAFSLDAVGSQGCVRCPGSNAGAPDYLVGVSIQMSSFKLTKMVTVSPFYTLLNKSSYELEVGELVDAATRWHYISSSECLPLWPESHPAKLRVRAVGAERASPWFRLDRQDNGTLLALDTCGGITVEVNVSDHSTVVGLGDYFRGAAPALLINHTARAEVAYRQSGPPAADRRLKPGEARRFAWDDPAGVRTLAWSCGRHSGETGLLKDEWGDFWPEGGPSQVYWASFLDGRQRVLIFTEDAGVVTRARQAEQLEQFREELRLSLRHLGLSLVDADGRREVAYVGVTSSGVVWEMWRKNRWRPLSQKHIALLEEAHRGVGAGRSPAGPVRLDGELEVELGVGVGGATMRRPHVCPLRRNFLPAVQVELKRSPHQRSLRAQLHWFQVDNQLPGAVFPVAFHPVPPPKSLALDSEPKAFLDMSVITRSDQRSGVTQFKYFMVLVQEMAVKVDRGFLSATLALLAPAEPSGAAEHQRQLVQKDMEMLQAELMQSSLDQASGLHYFQYFHISPVKLHLSLSLGPAAAAAGETDGESLNLLLSGIGATLIDVDDLLFKLDYFEVECQFYRREKLTEAATRHYSEQFLKQMYVLVLGLDVLGNPFGLIRGLSQGVEAFFYEPFQGAVRGPEEFAEGVAIGVRSLLGHTVGGAAGVVSRITGSVGKGLAAITMDPEYQRQRRDEMNRAPRDFGQSLAKGGKGFLKGVVGGVTGIVTKPVEGARKEGAAGFFKGIGKGLVGVVARPTGGVVDMASSAFQGIQRAAESTEQVGKLRPVRLIREDGIVRAYDLAEARGLDLFQRWELNALEGEVFCRHCPYPGRKKTNVVVTNRRVVCVKEVDFMAHFSKEWECLYENSYRPPDLSGTCLNIYCKEARKLNVGQKEQGRETIRSIQLQDENIARGMLSSVTEARAARLRGGGGGPPTAPRSLQRW
ncbi:intermembrane lipid transfer protein VPS13C isoform X2 [Stigmatopora nigra]